MQNKKRKINNQSGAAMLIAVVFFLFISLAIISGLVVPSVREFRNATANINSKQSYFLAESGGEDAVYRILNNLTLASTETLTLNNNSATTTTTTLVGNVKQIISLGDVGSLQRKTTIKLKTGDGEVFKYGTQAGVGGFVFQNNSHVSGSIYSNGNIVGSNGAYITGDAFVAGNTGSISSICVGGTISGGACTGATTGDAHAHTITNANVNGTIYATSSATGSTASGSIYCQTGSGNNKVCSTSPAQADPINQDLPIPDSDIAQWQTDATAGGTTTPAGGTLTISTPTILGPRKIVGNLTVSSTLTIAGTIYVTGNVNITGTVKLDTSYGATSGIVIADGYIIIGNGTVFQDSGTAGSYILFLSNSTCDESVAGSPCSGHNAIATTPRLRNQWVIR